MKLTTSDYPEFERLYRAQFEGEPPSITDAIILVEKRGGRIIGFGVVRLYTVLETFWVAPDMVGKSVLAKLAGEVLDAIPRLTNCFAFTKNDRLVRLFQYMGMEHLKDCQVLRWLRN
jgi:hypothetical protein